MNQSVTGWLSAFDGKKMVPDNFMDGVISYTRIKTVTQEHVYQKEAQYSGRNKEIFHSDRTGLRSPHLTEYVTLDKSLNLLNLNFIIYWLKKYVLHIHNVFNIVLSIWDALVSKIDTISASMELTFWRDVGMVGRLLRICEDS